MSRARNIKPGFFKNDQLAECHPLTRILFAALWCEADREGRLEDRPKRLKAECLPYDDCDVDSMLNELAEHGFIVRYTHGADRFIQVIKFSKHQNPHMREPASTIPAPVEHSASTVQAPDKPEPASVEHSASTEPARLFPLSPSLIPDSPSLIPEELPATPGASAPPGDAPAVVDPIWHTGLAFLARKGIPTPQARQFLGKLKREAGDIDAAALMAEAEAEDITEPIPWLSKAAVKVRERRNGGRSGTHRESVADRAARLAREGDERGRRNAGSAVARDNFEDKDYGTTDISKQPAWMREQCDDKENHHERA